MKNLALNILFIVLFFGSVQAQSNLDLKNNRISDELLTEILNFSEMKELKKPSPTTSPYFLRLYSIHDFGEENCAPKVETEVTCVIRYYLAVTDGSLGVPGTVYDLGAVGEITKIQWLENSNQDIARLRLEICNYPNHAFKLNSRLVKKTKTVELYVTTESLEIKKVN
jgi:hypothetical protein